jgi:predicted dehydrogenase
MRKKISRRDLIKCSAASAVAATVPGCFSIGKPGSANSKLNIAFIGAGNIAKRAYRGCEGENFVAIADIRQSMLDEALAGPAQGARAFKDFRVMLDKMENEIDAVCINTPDHTHFVATMDAMQRGKHVFTQKPLAHNVWQCRTLKKAKDEYRLVTNMGNQGHTYDGIRQLKEWYDAGLLGQVRTIRSWNPGPSWGDAYLAKPDRYPPETQPVPQGVDWDLWLGPTATDFGYNSIFEPKTWRGFYDFGSSTLGDWFCHICDGPVWILDLYDPVVVECEQRKESMPGVGTDSSIIRWDFENRGSKEACSLYWHDGGNLPEDPEKWDWGMEKPGSGYWTDSGYRTENPEDNIQVRTPRSGSYWFGENLDVYLDNRSDNPTLASMQEDKEFKLGGNMPEPTIPRVPEGAGEFGEWTSAIKGDGPQPGSNFDYAARLTEVALLGVLAQRFGGRIEWDAKNGTITNRPDLNRYLKEPVRKGWEYGDDLW